MALRVGACHCKSAPDLVWCPWVSATGDIIDLICNANSQDYLIERPCNLWAEAPCDMPPP